MFQISLPWVHLYFHNACPHYLKSRRDPLYIRKNIFCNSKCINNKPSIFSFSWSTIWRIDCFMGLWFSTVWSRIPRCDFWINLPWSLRLDNTTAFKYSWPSNWPTNCLRGRPPLSKCTTCCWESRKSSWGWRKLGGKLGDGEALCILVMSKKPQY